MSLRIIPALAGNTCCPNHSAEGNPDHPRSRGEYDLQFKPVPGKQGSSPLSRGIHKVVFADSLKKRIIPALAGNTAGRALSAAVVTDHPRSRGEYVVAERLRSGDRGSSPLSRGIRTVKSHELPRRGIIPALAGNTRKPRMKPPHRTDHPRSRGEYPNCPRRGRRCPGSSPLSRGILRRLP